MRVIEIANPTITREIHVKIKAKDSFVEKDLDNDIIPVAMINRKNLRQRGNGFIKGTGIKNGAVATTLTWDTGNVLAIGSSEEDMACAVIAKQGRIIYEFSMPLFGIMPLVTMEEIADKITELSLTLQEIGTYLEKPYLNIQTIPFTGLPYLRITDKGLVDVKNKKLVPLFVK